MTRYPQAEWVPWRFNNGTGQAFFLGRNKPVAVVLHVMEGWASTARQWALSGHYGASWHYTVALDGSVMQHLEHRDGGYHAGIASPPAPTPTWSLWQGSTVNVNNYTIGIEHEGFSGNGFPPAQAAASKALCQWLAAELGFPYDREHFPPHADIDLVNRANDFAPPAMREAHYAYMFEEDDMTPEEVAKIASGQWLELFKQTVGVKDSTFSDQASVAEIRTFLGTLGAGIPNHEHVDGTSGPVKR